MEEILVLVTPLQVVLELIVLSTLVWIKCVTSKNWVNKWQLGEYVVERGGSKQSNKVDDRDTSGEM
jgi:hypothetical protein